MSIDRRESVSLDSLSVGSRCPSEYVDAQGVLLIASGVEITTSLIEKLRSRGITAVHPAQPSTASVPQPQRRVTRGKRQAPPRLDALSPSYDAAKVQRIRKQFVAGERALVQLTEGFKRNRITDLRDTEPHVDSYINELADDPDPIVANALKYETDLQLARRCVQFSVLSLAIGQQLSLSPAEMRDIGTAALVHDWGLFDLPPQHRFPHQMMDDSTRAKYIRHPTVAGEMLQYVDSVTPAVRRIVTQVHELLDGSGFPNRVKANDIPLDSRVVAVADAYLTMTCPPRDCPRIVPCDAIAFLISAATQGRYAARAVTALLKAVTMYPIGSLVELSDTTKARVIRSNGNDYGYPIVETLTLPSRVLNLKESELFVTRPVTSAEHNEVRLSETYSELSQSLSSCPT